MSNVNYLRSFVMSPACISAGQLADELRTVRGFEYLTRVSSDTYEAAFREAISSADLTVFDALVAAHVPDVGYIYRQNPQANYEHVNTDGATITFDMSLSNKHTVTLGGDRILAVANDADGQVFKVELVQGAPGGWTPTWWSGIKWAGGSVPTLTATAAKTDVFSFERKSAGNYYGFVVGLNF